MQRGGRSVPAARGRGRPVGADSAQTRRRIVRAAREVINQRGYPAMTFQAISKHTGLSRPTLHYYFASREDLYRAVMEEAKSMLTSAIERSLAHDALLDRLATFFVALQEAEQRDRSTIAFTISARLEPQRNPELLPFSAPSPVRQFLTRVVEDGVAHGEIRADTDTAAIVSMLHVVMWGLGCYASFVARPDDMEPVTQQLVRLFAGGLPTEAAGDRPG
ncbi:TetR/AcrR family transcriptional regulator [Mycobacterium sp. NPDC050041]|uniref:TetR/AcrR family transcriptional regulator n=1 Tax=Mycobacterium sp. NPDC050041 TaxID=3364293 RepID=UPI003C2C9B8D